MLTFFGLLLLHLPRLAFSACVVSDAASPCWHLVWQSHCIARTTLARYLSWTRDAVRWQTTPLTRQTRFSRVAMDCLFRECRVPCSPTRDSIAICFAFILTFGCLLLWLHSPSLPHLSAEKSYYMLLSHLYRPPFGVTGWWRTANKRFVATLSPILSIRSSFRSQ